jgi:hypothetical protein
VGEQLVPGVLVELPGGEGVVRRDDGEIVVCRDVGTLTLAIPRARATGFYRSRPGLTAAAGWSAVY